MKNSLSTAVSSDCRTIRGNLPSNVRLVLGLAVVLTSFAFALATALGNSGVDINSSTVPPDVAVSFKLTAQSLDTLRQEKFPNKIPNKILEELLRDGPHLPCYGNQSSWGAPDLWETDFLRSPWGPGWRLDRAAFDRLLLERAEAGGADVQRRSRFVEARRQVDACH